MASSGIQSAKQPPKAPLPGPPPTARPKNVVITFDKSIDLRPAGILILVILVLALIGIIVLVKNVFCCCCRSSKKPTPPALVTAIHPQIHHPQPFPQGAPVHMASSPGFMVHPQPASVPQGSPGFMLHPQSPSVPQGSPRFMVHSQPNPAPPRY